MTDEVYTVQCLIYLTVPITIVITRALIYVSAIYTLKCQLYKTLDFLPAWLYGFSRYKSS